MGIRGDEHLRSSAARQIELYRVGVAMTAIQRAKRQLGRSGDEGITLIDRLFQTSRISAVVLCSVNVTV